VHSARMDWSAVPPAGQGQMKVMGRSGQFWAKRGPVAASALAPSVASTNSRRLAWRVRGVFIACLLYWLFAAL